MAYPLLARLFRLTADQPVGLPAGQIGWSVLDPSTDPDDAGANWRPIGDLAKGLVARQGKI